MSIVDVIGYFLSDKYNGVIEEEEIECEVGDMFIALNEGFDVEEEERIVNELKERLI